jgi:charged multivesicular body protein 7
MMDLRTQLFAIVALFAVISVSSGVQWDDLKVTFGVNPFSSNTFVHMPLTTTEADGGGWEKLSQTCTNDNNFYGFRYMLNNDPGVTLLYDVNGVIAGIQMNLLKSEVLSSKNKYKYDKVSMFQTTTINGKDVFTLTAYFVNPGTICTTGRNETDLKTKGTGDSLFLQNGAKLPLDSTNLIRVPLKRSNAIRDGWTKNQCFYGMGYHNFYKSEEFQSTNCEEIRPVFLLYNSNDELHGFGFAGNGVASSPRFEHPGRSAIKAIIGNDAAECILDATQTPGISTVHVYFIKRPYFINCWF